MTARFPTPGGDPAATPNTRRLCASTSIPRYSANKSRRRNSRMGWRCTIIIPRGSKTGGDGSSKQSGRAAVAILCLQNYGKAQERTSGAASIRSGRRTPSLLRCIAISLSGFTPNLIAGSPCGKRRACSLFTMAFVSVAVSTSSYAAGPAVDAARKLKPTIPVIGEHGIPVHEEIDLCRVLATNSAEDLTARPPWSQNPAQRPEIRHDCQKSP